ncbi:hypothetical protein CIHG_10405 [Coccidioides immitis H538.4]|uniref:Secreted protein n=3 Tax=Coccidioides immitis TaxID=5501 RepID=A0A0J8U379_COCIT|nr:hypothetical protein CIRG_09191 [Coccidioides immitis RMSCC 2394]KMU81147.1 hypothetical protein CISG_02524 [Coccidioides immitis RMSCC 3703]KMU92580.1 hypothetical protein CIHG_10405 [Coccidioides immitis H538.4]
MIIGWTSMLWAKVMLVLVGAPKMLGRRRQGRKTCSLKSAVDFKINTHPVPSLDSLRVDLPRETHLPWFFGDPSRYARAHLDNTFDVSHRRNDIRKRRYGRSVHTYKHTQFHNHGYG